MSDQDPVERFRRRMTAPGSTSPVNFTHAVLKVQREHQAVAQRDEAERSRSREAVTKMLGFLTGTYRFDAQLGPPEKQIPAYHLVLDKLEVWQIRQAGELALERHKYPTMPRPADFHGWATEATPEAEARKWPVKHGGRLTGKDVEWETDEHGYEKAVIKRSPQGGS